MREDGVGTFGRPVADDVACSECGTGWLVRRQSGDGGTFYGCSNYPYCERAERPCPACGEGLRVREGGTVRCRERGSTAPGCPLCDGVLLDRNGPYGPFLGCSNYPACTYKRDKRRSPAAPRWSGTHRASDRAQRSG